MRFEDGPIVYFLGKNHNGSHLAVCARLHKPVMLNGAETHGERKEGRASGGKRRCIRPRPISPRGTKKETNEKGGRKEGGEGMQIKARLVDPPVDARIPQITYSKINDARAKTWRGKGFRNFSAALHCQRTYEKQYQEMGSQKATGYGYFWITSPLTMV